MNAGSNDATSTTPSPSLLRPQHARIVVGFANEPQRSPSPAGTTGGRYRDNGYLTAQRAHRAALHVAADYSLRLVASWPIKALAVHCVVYEVPDDRAVPNLLAALAKDSRVAFAQPLEEFRTQGGGLVSTTSRHD